MRSENVHTHFLWAWQWVWFAQLFQLSVHYSNFPAMTDHTLDLWAKTNPFSPKLLFFGVFYHNNRNKVRWPPSEVIIFNLVKASRAKSPGHLQSARILVYPTVYFTLGGHCMNQRKCMSLGTYIIMEDRFQLIIIQTRIKGPLGCTKHHGKLKKSGNIDDMVKCFQEPVSSLKWLNAPKSKNRAWAR